MFKVTAMTLKYKKRNGGAGGCTSMEIRYPSKDAFQRARSQDNFGNSKSWFVSKHIPFVSWHEIAGWKDRFPWGVLSWSPLQVVKKTRKVFKKFHIITECYNHLLVFLWVRGTLSSSFLRPYVTFSNLFNLTSLLTIQCQAQVISGLIYC